MNSPGYVSRPLELHSIYSLVQGHLSGVTLAAKAEAQTTASYSS